MPALSLPVGFEPDTPAGFEPDSVPTGFEPDKKDQAGEDYLKRVAESNRQPLKELSPEEKARTGQIYAEPGEVTGGTKQDPINQQPLVPASWIETANKVNPYYWAARAVAPEQTEGAVKGLSQAESGFTSPSNLALLAATPLFPEGTAGKLAGTGLGAYFEAQAVKNFPEQWKQFQETTDPQEKWRLGAEMTAGLGLPLTALVHAMSPTERGVSKDLGDVVPSNTEEVVPQQSKLLEKPPIQRVSPETGQTFYDFEGRTEPTPEAQPQPVPQTEQPAPSSVEDVGVSNKAFEALYGEGAIPTGEGYSPKELKALGDERLAKGDDPYATLTKGRKQGILPAEDVALLRSEHGRLVADARASEGTPDWESKSQFASDFAKAIQPFKTSASDVMRGLQEYDQPKFDSLTDFDQYIRDRLNRETTPVEKKTFQRAANDVREATNGASSEAGQAVDRVRNYRPKERISMDDATKSLHDQISELTKDCIL